jgi:hypothetical protein
MSEDKLSQLSEAKYINIETYRKNGLGKGLGIIRMLRLHPVIFVEM